VNDRRLADRMRVNAITTARGRRHQIETNYNQSTSSELISLLRNSGTAKPPGEGANLGDATCDRGGGGEKI